MRRAIYGAALQQFEELLTAASVVGPASRPLPLFYALSQAGRAIVAAFGDVPATRGHGLQEATTGLPLTDVLHFSVKRQAKNDRTDLFGAVCRATSSRDFEGAIEIGAAWAALPSMFRVPRISWRPDWRSVLMVHDHSRPDRRSEETTVMVSSLSGNPHLANEHVLGDLATRYPTLAPSTHGVVRQTPDLPPGSWFVDLTWRKDERSLDEVAPTFGFGTPKNSRYLVPTLPGQGDILNAFVTWWVLLFGLSLVARYEPNLWTTALVVDATEQAVPLEAILDNALDAVPHWVYQALLVREL
jgi:hypothetical protein